jgi:hypothetical protein
MGGMPPARERYMTGLARAVPPLTGDAGKPRGMTDGAAARRSGPTGIPAQRHPAAPRRSSISRASIDDGQADSGRRYEPSTASRPREQNGEEAVVVGDG